MQEKASHINAFTTWNATTSTHFQAGEHAPVYLRPDGTLSAQPGTAAKMITLHNEVKKSDLSLRRAFETQFTNITEAIPQSRLAFETTAFEEEVIVIGRPELRLSIASSAKSYQVVGLLKDVSAEGKQFLISRFALASRVPGPGLRATRLPSKAD